MLSRCRVSSFGSHYSVLPTLWSVVGNVWLIVPTAFLGMASTSHVALVLFLSFLVVDFNYHVS